MLEANYLNHPAGWCSNAIFQHTGAQMMNDPYREVRSIRDSLDRVGQHEYAEQIRRALIEGSAGTEIYMILRSRLTNIAGDPAIAMDIRTRVQFPRDYLDRALAS